LTDEDLNFDIDNDGVSDVIVKKTNGHTVYLNLTWVLKRVGVCIGLLTSLVVTYLAL